MQRNDITNGVNLKSTMYSGPNRMDTVTWSDMGPNILDGRITEQHRVQST